MRWNGGKKDIKAQLSCISISNSKYFIPILENSISIVATAKCYISLRTQLGFISECGNITH